LIEENSSISQGSSQESSQEPSPESSVPGASEDLLLLAADAIRKSIEQSLRQLNARRVRSEMKLRWSRSLVQQVEGLVKVAEALDKLGSKSSASLDLSSYLSAVQEKVPKQFESRRLKKIFCRYHASGLTYATLRRL